MYDFSDRVLPVGGISLPAGFVIKTLTGSLVIQYNGTTVTTITQTGVITGETIDLAAGVTGTLPASHGGTGNASYTIGDILYASAATTLAKLLDVATGNVILSGGVGAIPAWGKVGLTTHVTGTLAVGSGGTGVASYAVGDIVYASGAATLASLVDVATGQVLASGGIGAAPAYTANPSVTTVTAATSMTSPIYAMNATSTLTEQILTNTSGDTLLKQSQLAPVACTAALAGAGAGNVDSGTHSYKVTFITAGGQTEGGAVSNTVTTAGGDGQVNLTVIPKGSPYTTQRKVYRTAAGNAVVGPWLLLATIVDNTTTTYADNIADVNLTTTIPVTNTALDTRFAVLNSGAPQVPLFVDKASNNAGTLTNAPSIGDPAKWLSFSAGGTTYAVPLWTIA